MTASRSLLAVILLAAAAGVDALVFDVLSGGSKCLTVDLRRGALSHKSYRVTEATSAAASTVSARVAGPRGEELHLTEGVEAGEFRFEAAEDGRYTACFWTPRYERGTIVSVDVQWATGVRDNAGAGPPPAVAAAKEGHINPTVGELKKLEVSARLIYEEMISLRRSEDEMQKLNEDNHENTLLHPVISGSLRWSCRAAAVASKDFLSKKTPTLGARWNEEGHALLFFFKKFHVHIYRVLPLSEFKVCHCTVIKENGRKSILYVCLFSASFC